MYQPQIVVGVDGSASSRQALRWAAQQAERTGRSLLVAYLSEAAERLGDYGFGDDLARRIVGGLTREHPALPVHTVVIEGDPAEFLLHSAAKVAMLVLGHEQQPDMISLGGTVTEVLARSEFPVVVLGASAENADVGTRIVLRASVSPGGIAAMRFACEEAVRARVPVLAVRSSLDPDWKIADVSTLSAVPEGNEQFVLDQCLDQARGRFPGVVISGLLTAEAIRFALARESHDALMVVLGCGAATYLHDRKLGPDTLIALHSLACAVAVVGPGTEADSDRRLSSGDRREEARAFGR